MSEPNPFEERVVEEAQRIVGAHFDVAYEDYCAQRNYDEDQVAALAVVFMGMASLSGSVYLSEATSPLLDVFMVGGSTAVTVAGLSYMAHNFYDFARRKSS